MSIRVLHLSDLHTGKREDPAVAEALRGAVERFDPALVVASGDLTHRGRPEQYDAAEELLRSLGRPLLCVPGNHDIPFLPPARVTRPWAEFERRFGTTEPVVRQDGLVAVGLNSVRPRRHQSGAVERPQLERAAAALSAAPAGDLRLVALHHHLVGAPWRSRKRPVSRRAEVLAALASAGAELVVAGHIHQHVVCERRDFEADVEGERALVVAIAPGFGRPRPHREREARGLNLYEADEETIVVRSAVWHDGGFRTLAERRFPRGAAAL